LQNYDIAISVIIKVALNFRAFPICDSNHLSKASVQFTNMKDRAQRRRSPHHHSAEFRRPDIRSAHSRPVPGLTARPSPLHGLGCFATQHFPKGRKIAEYEGLRVRFDDLSTDEAPWDLNYIVGIDEVWAVDGSRGGNETRYINHSCKPNVYLRITHGHPIFYALRDIQPDEELVWDYVLMDNDGRIDPCPCEKKKNSATNAHE